MLSESFGRMDEITNEGDGEGPGCMASVAALSSLVIVAALCIAAVVAVAGYALAQ